MRAFYLNYDICQSLAGKLSWTYCSDKDALTVEYALGGLSNNIFASKYTYYILDKEKLIAEVEKIVRRWND